LRIQAVSPPKHATFAATKLDECAIIVAGEHIAWFDPFLAFKVSRAALPLQILQRRLNHRASRIVSLLRNGVVDIPDWRKLELVKESNPEVIDQTRAPMKVGGNDNEEFPQKSALQMFAVMLDGRASVHGCTADGGRRPVLAQHKCHTRLSFIGEVTERDPRSMSSHPDLNIESAPKLIGELFPKEPVNLPNNVLKGLAGRDGPP